MSLQEGVQNLWAKGEGDSSIIVRPKLNAWVWIRPQEIDQKPNFPDIRRTLNASYLIKVFQFWGQATMHAQDPVIDGCTHRHPVEGIAKGLPQLHGVAPVALVPSNKPWESQTEWVKRLPGHER